jgi:threonine/homoserine/homoserine lactone efflux protein
LALELWLALLAANTALLLTPGPSMLLIVGTALERGTRASLATVVGIAFGAQTAMLASLLGIGALLAASTAAFTALKLVGAAYLVYLGVRAWRTPVRPLETASFGPERRLALVGRGFLTSLFNPKSFVFYVAFLPQFLDAARPFAPQLAIMGATFFVQGLVFDVTLALLAGRARRLLATPAAGRTANRLAAACLVGAGLLTLTLRRSA